MDAAVARQEAGQPFVHVPVRGGEVAGELVHRVLRDHEEAAGKRVPVEVAPDGHDALVLLGVDHAVELVDHREQPPVVRLGGVAGTRQDPDAHDQRPPAELHRREVAGQVDHHPAAGAAAQPEEDEDQRRVPRPVDALREVLEFPLQRARLVVVGLPVDRLGDGARDVLAGVRLLELNVVAPAHLLELNV
jgi:hypothetical protein